MKYVPAKLIVEEHITYSYACKACEKETGESNIVSAQAPKTIFTTAWLRMNWLHIPLL
ncbi:IS66 family transposase zinc-finger binding domain-containing protein [Caloramator sp. mosi_1]|uniref:IS66 family transposase zinc-finger binding domain-containing protein n=1 Tax=Caloramator sp. mosi_1 TaxID=3023090 RepID=UPI003FCEC7E3